MLAIKDDQLFIPTTLEIFDRFQIFFQFISNGSLGRTLTVLFVGFPNIPDNEVEVIQNHVTKILIIADMGGLQHFQMRVIFAGARPFNDFMPDGIDKCIEIYVDGIATMQIQNLNTLVDTVRHEIIERYRPGEDDPHLKVLQAAHISDDEYFSHMVLDDLNLIIRDIRETHKKDSESAPQTTVANELKENLEAVENFKGSRLEKLAVLYCKQLGINYKNLSDEEFRWLIRILQKSKKTGTPINQRKKR